MSATSPSLSYAVTLGHSLDKQRHLASSSSFVSVKYNFKPPSITPSSLGYLHSLDQSNSQWSLEYDMREREEDRRGTRSSAQGFQGSQAVGKDVDCVLVWDDHSQSYVLDRVASTFSFKYDRGHTKLSDKAMDGLSNRRSSPDSHSPELSTGALGLNLTASDEAIESTAHHDDLQGSDEKEGVGGDDEDDDEAEFARQLELGLGTFAADGEDKDSSMEELEAGSPQRAKTGLGLLEGSGLRDDVLTPRGSPYIDRPKSNWESTKSNLGHSRGIIASQLSNNTARSTPVVSPASVTNSPRPVGLDSVLSVSSTWKPPAQRSNVAIDYDEDEEEGDDESDEEEEDDDDEEEEEDDDGDLDDYARQLESSLQG